MTRYLVLFAREPGREAREKGLSPSTGGHFFAALARGWREAARQVGAELALATSQADRAGWQRWFRGATPPLWLQQRGSAFGERLESAGRAAAALDGHAVLVGGDVLPSVEALEDAFRLLESGSDAVIAPASDGGFSLVALKTEDLDLLRGVAPRRVDACRRLCLALVRRGRSVARVSSAPDVDGRRTLRFALRGDDLGPALRAAARRALDDGTDFLAGPEARPSLSLAADLPGLRAPPVALSF